MDGLFYPKPDFQDSPSVVTSFFHRGACDFNSSIIQEQAANPATL